jgi:hypothetical protein
MEEVRAAAAESLGKLGPDLPDEAIIALMYAVKNDVSRGVQQAALFSLSGVGMPADEGIPFFANSLGVRGACLALEQYGEQAYEPLVEFILTEPLGSKAMSLSLQCLETLTGEDLMQTGDGWEDMVERVRDWWETQE